MAGRRFLVSSNIEVLQQSEGMQRSILLGSRPLVKFEDDSGNCQNRPSFKPIELDDITEDDFNDCFHHPEKKRRLTADQVQFLEQSFEVENKLEPERKLQIAKFLGLRPRQVAIWFQNRRARWKTKQMEKDYEALQSRFDALKLDHDLHLKEKEKLQAEVLALSKKLLVKENNERLESFELKKSPNKLPNSHSPLGFDVKLFKQEDISSDNSTIFESESPNYVDKSGYSMLMELTAPSNAFDINNSERSQIGEVDDDAFELHDTEQDLWLWA